MIRLSKEKNKDFTILNLTDFQLNCDDWRCGSDIHRTLDELVKRVKPNLITLSGDITYCGDVKAMECVANKLDSYNIPYAMVWGNHDQDGGLDKLDEVIEKALASRPLFTYEQGPSELGRGNYVIAICEGDAVVSGLIMMDSHDKVPFIADDGSERLCWGRLSQKQLEWYKRQSLELKALGCKDTTIITHIPLSVYKNAFDEAFALEDSNKITVAESYESNAWKEGYKDSFGVRYEEVTSYPVDEGVFDAILDTGMTKNIIVGHNHTSNFSIKYKGIRLTFSLKTGRGSYYTEELNGGTVIRIGESGVYGVEHAYVK